MRVVSAAAGLCLAALVSGCAPGALAQRLPEGVGLPENAPARPATPYPYPAVHDMPPDRPAKPMSEEEQVRLEKELARTRDSQAGREEQVGTQTKKPAAGAKSGSNSGTNTGAKPNP